jgi:hypothetical protein
MTTYTAASPSKPLGYQPDCQRCRFEDQCPVFSSSWNPAADDIIINLNALYADPGFMETVRATSARLDKTFRGIERWKGSQEEVVLKETTIANDEIVSLGAFRQISDVVPLVGTRPQRSL